MCCDSESLCKTVTNCDISVHINLYIAQINLYIAQIKSKIYKLRSQEIEIIVVWTPACWGLRK